MSLSTFRQWPPTLSTECSGHFGSSCRRLDCPSTTPRRQTTDQPAEEWDAFFRSVPNPNDNLSMAEFYEQSHFQTRGVEETYESDTFPGVNVGPLATELIAIPSFSRDRMKSLLAFAESRYNVRESSVRWFLGQPPDRHRNGWRFQALANLYNVRHEGIGVSTRDYREVFQRLDLQWEELHTERHLVIASLGSKMQHLGTFLFLAMHRECGLLLCEPREFIAERYSTGIGPRWWLDFGAVSEIGGFGEPRQTRVHLALNPRWAMREAWTAGSRANSVGDVGRAIGFVCNRSLDFL